MNDTYRPEIEGLRALAVTLVAVFHVWFGTVSGGVDVFLLLTGFLITGSLVRMAERSSGLSVRSVATFWVRLAKRLVPVAAVVLGAVLLLTYLVLPRSRWSDVIAEVIAAGTYQVNWHLAQESVDYMARGETVSPVQHFWSLSVQGQFYLLWPVLVGLVALVAHRRGWSLRRAVLGILAVVTAASFTYSVWRTGTEPQLAYFDTGARLWELGLGGLLALLLPHVRLPVWMRVPMGWLGVTALVLCGVVVGGTVPFPGYIALWPVGAGILVILAGVTGSRFGVDRVLTLRPVIWFGSLAYPLFLWHWPVLVFYLDVTERVRPSLVGGGYVLATSFVLALVTRWVIEGGVTRITVARPSPRVVLAACAAFLLPVLVAGSLWNSHLEEQHRMRAELSSDPHSYPGAGILVDERTVEELPELPPYPDTGNAARVTWADLDGCIVGSGDDDFVTCEFGAAAEEAQYSIALVGHSHARHWFRAVEGMAERNGWHLTVMTKNACDFSVAPLTRDGDPYPGCSDWNEQAMDELAERDPDVVFTTGTRTAFGEAQEEIPAGVLERWDELASMGIDVVAIRDTPRPDEDVPECVDRNGAAACVWDLDELQPEVSPLDEAELPPNVATMDLTEYVCPDGQCPAVIGNQLVYYDGDHFTYSFSASLSQVMEPYWLEVTGWEATPVVG
ncbi:acyltransferase family protein [Lipingzhangella sp. LS1_29]|uniref:Acyltransferase family protein n=1 Tax=Lipingzhangella rawalii TaxID=2055835 RepID=A0ABU2H5M3_9ACTN|nr:acyltransferase family protein [Lipingzhangella rawalii]MDS1270591.1 acyltransferase family protein [Lipingzhangella rawalii]